MALNLPKQDVIAQKPDRKQAGDIGFIPTNGGWPDPTRALVSCTV